MNYVIGAIAGLIWGGAVSFLNYLITKNGLSKNNAKAMIGINLARNIVNIGALAAVFFLRRFLPFSYEATLIATAISMSAVTIFITLRLSKKV